MPDPRYCDDCVVDATRYPPWQLCKVCGCAGGCGGVRLGDGLHCGGDDGEICDPTEFKVIARVR